MAVQVSRSSSEVLVRPVQPTRHASRISTEVLVRRIDPPRVPSDISGLVGWWRADNITGLVDAAPVVSWPDSSSFGRAMGTATTTRQPLFKRDQINGRPAVLFDGTNDMIASQGARYVGADGTWTAFAVVTRTSGTSFYSILDQDYSDSPRVAQFLRSNNGVLESIAFNSANAATADTAGTMSSFNQPYIVSAKRGLTSIEAFLNGVSNGETATSGTPNASQGLLTIGARTVTTSSAYWRGLIAEVILYDRNLNAAEQSQVHSYLQDKYAVSVSDYVPYVESGFTGWGVPL